MIDLEKDKTALKLVDASIILLKEAEHLNGQPLFYNKDGNYVRVVESLEFTSKHLKKFIEGEERFSKKS